MTSSPDRWPLWSVPGQLLRSLRAGMIVLLDRGFDAAGLLQAVKGIDADSPGPPQTQPLAADPQTLPRRGPT
jgi:hypothetical protein